MNASQAESDKVYGVGELTRHIRDLLEGSVGSIWVEGEVSNYRKYGSGHHYFTLKDEKAQLSCVLFKGSARANPRLNLEDGVQIQAYGEISVYEARGQYQLVVKLVQEQGHGALQARFEALKRQLESEGLFASERKRPLPPFPRRIAIVTSPSGAALRDFLHVLHRRAPWIEVLVAPTLVQGKGSEKSIAEAIETLSPDTPGLPELDAIVVSRGGGSLEDLWSFNEEVVARAIAASKIPVVSGVGHEVDFTIADFVADLRAPTPSAAAELIAPDGLALKRQIEALSRTLDQRVKQRLQHLGSLLSVHGDHLAAREPTRFLRNQWQQLDYLAERRDAALRHRLRHLEQRLRAPLSRLHPARAEERVRASSDRLHNRRDALEAAGQRRLDREAVKLVTQGKLLQSLNPRSVFARGYSLTTLEDGTILRDAENAEPGQTLVTRLAQGELRSRVESPSREDR